MGDASDVVVGSTIKLSHNGPPLLVKSIETVTIMRGVTTHWGRRLHFTKEGIRPADVLADDAVIFCTDPNDEE